MSLYKVIKQKMKNDDRTEFHRFAGIWLLCFGVFLVIDIATKGVPLLFLVFVPPLVAVIAMGIIKIGGSIAGSIYGGRKARWSVKEKLAGDLEKIRYSKRQGRFDEALILANDSLKHLPNDPEALFLKAQILHEGVWSRRICKKMPGDHH